VLRRFVWAGFSPATVRKFRRKKCKECGKGDKPLERYIGLSSKYAGM